MNIFKVLFIIISCLIVFVLTDFLYFNIYINQQNQSSQIYLEKYINSYKLINFTDEYDYWNSKENLQDRDYINLNSKKRPVLIMGCSFGYGFELDSNQTFQYKLGQLTHRSIYNRAVPSFGLQHAIYMLENYNFEKEIKNPEYIIYVFINEHIYRLYRRVYDVTEPILDINYNFKNSDFVKEKKCKFFYRFAIFRRISNLISLHTLLKLSDDLAFDNLKLYFLQFKKIAKEKYPDTKLVILIFEESSDSLDFCPNRWKELEKEGFIVINSYNLTKLHLSEEEYRLPSDKFHPNEYAWDIITPEIAQELNL